jgi:hypothetical protein
MESPLPARPEPPSIRVSPGSSCHGQPVPTRRTPTDSEIPPRGRRDDRAADRRLAADFRRHTAPHRQFWEGVAVLFLTIATDGPAGFGPAEGAGRPHSSWSRAGRHRAAGRRSVAGRNGGRAGRATGREWTGSRAGGHRRPIPSGVVACSSVAVPIGRRGSYNGPSETTAHERPGLTVLNWPTIDPTRAAAQAGSDGGMPARRDPIE